MSGGAFNYRDGSLLEEMYPYSCWNRGNEGRDMRDDPFEDPLISELMYDLLRLTHELDWYKSADTSQGTYLEAKKKFCEKWFGKKRGTKALESLVRRQFESAMNECRKMIADLSGKETGTE